MDPSSLEYWWILIIGTTVILALIISFIGSLINSNRRLKEERDFISSIFEAAPALMVILNDKNEIVRVNKTCEKLTGLNANEILGQKFNMLAGNSVLQVENTNKVNESSDRQNIDHFESRLINKKNEDFVIAWYNKRLSNIAGNLKWIIATGLDITVRKKAEEQIKESLVEKEALLSEVHHRVKNNLQIITSLLHLQSRQIDDKKILDIFNDSQNRIQTMAIVHEILYQSKDFARIDLSVFVKKLSDQVFRTYKISTSKVLFKMRIKDVFLPADVALPLGLVINEILSNSLKYAFPDHFEELCEINIFIYKLDQNNFELIITDNGIGISESIDINETKSLGLHLVNLLIRNQLHGEIKIDRTHGTKYEIKFAGRIK